MWCQDPACVRFKKGNGDYRLSVYVRVVSTLRFFIFDEEEEFKRVKQQLMEAAFDDDYIMQQRE